jgi:hypothetical protein
MARPKKNVEIEESSKEVKMQTEVTKPIAQIPVPQINPAQLAEPVRQLSSQEYADQQWEALKKEEITMVKGRFINLEMRGGSGYVCAAKFKGEEPFMMTMEDDEIYEIPLYAARYINQYCSYPTYKEAKDERGKIAIKEAVRVQRYRFEPLSAF